MKFLRQLLLLLWKNVKLRWQNKVRISFEIILPLFLFFILIWVRTRGLRTDVPDCYFVEKPLPSSGLLPFLRGYICEVNDTCYDYPVNNNYDEKFFTNVTSAMFDISNLLIKIMNNVSSADINTLIRVGGVMLNQRQSASDYTRSLKLIDTVFDEINFTNTINLKYNYLNETIIKNFFNSSPNFNLLYNETYSKPYQNMNAFNLPPFLFNFLFGSDLDALGSNNVPLDNPDYVRSRICNAQLLDRNQMFRVDTDKNFFYQELCNLNDTSLTDLVKYVSANINFTSVQMKVALNTNLTNPLFYYDIIQAADVIQGISQNIQSIQGLSTILNTTIPQFQQLFQNFSLQKALCGSSNASIFSFFDSKLINRLTSNFSLPISNNTTNSTINNFNNTTTPPPSPSNSNNTTTNSSTNQIFQIISYLNYLNELNDTQCMNVTKIEITSNRSCLCETLFTTLNRLPGGIKIIWKQLKPVFTGKLLYAPNTPIYNNLIKEINSTFEIIGELTDILSQASVVINSIDDFKPIIEIIINTFFPNTTYQADIDNILQNLQFAREVVLVVRNLIKCLEWNKFQGYEYEYQAVDAAMSMIETDTFWAAIIFNDGKDEGNSTSLPDKINYKIRMATSYTHNTFYAQDRSYRYGPNNCPTCNIDYLFGYIYLQDMIEKAIIEMKTNTTQNFGIVTQMSGYPCYVNDKFVNAITRTLPLFMVLAWIFTVSMLIKDIVYEKEKRLKEFMRVMGLNNGTHWTAWFITSFLSMMFVCLILVIILKFGKIMTYSDFSVLLVFFCCFTIATITQCFLISVFFNRANLAAAVGGIIYFLLYLPYSILVNYADVLQIYQQFLASLSSTVAFGYGCQLIATFELQSTGSNWDNFYQSPYTDGGLSMNNLCLIMLFDGFIYMLLTWYIENIAPGEFGIARPLYFPFQPSYWFGESYKKKFKNCSCCAPKQKNQKKNLNGTANGIHNDFNDQNEKIGIEILNLHKIYSRGRNHALKGLSLNFYENEITSFLGHNGAGKSTTMHILTGLYAPSSGTAKINGMDITENMDEIRKSLGFVPQHNVLFDNMTVIDHLWFYARLKGLDVEATKQEMEKLLVDTGLVKKRNELSKNLSGGMQRKLSVAVAFVGGSKTVILDEPSAGVDPNGRRGIWDLLFKYRYGRTIIISTHHMDEADILGDRIAIIANGQLVCFGSALSLKHKYGRGYYLTLVKKEKKLEDEVEEEERNDINNNKLIDSSQIIDTETANDFNSLSDISRSEHDDENDEKKQVEVLKTLKTQKDILIHKFIKSRIQNAILFENIGNEMTYTISNKQEYTKNYQQFFHDIEENIDTLGIDGITISDTTLEEIFVKLAKQPETIVESRLCKCCNCKNLSWSCFKDFFKNLCRNKEQIAMSSETNSRVSSAEKSEKSLLNKKNKVDVDAETLKMYASYTKARVNSIELPLQQLRGLIIKRFHRVKRNIKGFIAEIILPIVFVCLALLVSISIPPVVPRPPLEIHPWLYDNSPNYIYYSESSQLNITSKINVPSDVKKITNTFFESPSLGTRCMKNHQISITTYTDNFRSNKLIKDLKCLDNGYTISNSSENNLPNDLYYALQSTNFTYSKVSPGCTCSTGFPKCPLGAGGDIEYRTRSQLLTNDTLVDLTGRNVTDWLIKTEFNDIYFRKRYGGFEFLEPYFSQIGVDNFYDLSSRIIKLLGTNSTINSREINSKNALINNKRVKVWYNNKGYYAHVGYLNTINNAILRAKIKDINKTAKLDNYGIVSINHPLNYTNGDLVSILTQQIFIDLFVAICIIFALSFIPASFLVFLVEERETHCKQLQFISGVKPYIYWLSNYLWDLVNFVVPCFLCIIVFIAFNVETYMAKENLPCLIALMLLYGWACIPLMYPLNYIFQIPSSAFVLSSCINVFIGVISTTTTSILEQLGNEEPDLLSINEILKPIFVILFPHYCLGRGFLDMSFQYNTAKAQRILGFKDYTFNPFKFSIVGRNLVALAVQGVVYFLINLLIEYKFFINIKPAKVPKSELKASTEDEDVENERKRILEGVNNRRNSDDESKIDYIRLENLTKVYRKLKKCTIKKHVAVKSLCLGINKGECFGLIGVNGAGKTTTFKMLTGDTSITAGDAYVNGNSVSKDLEKVHQNIGYCPQKDAIFPLLTAREHLLFYARLRGVPETYINKVGIWALNRVGLNVFADRVANDFSGGNKRKLATAIALVGDPTVIALDEPTSGMDAKARRLLWNDILSLIKEDRIVILTSHSMEECEALCTRLVIMVNGEFKCIGSPRHLKLKFGSGYKVAIRLNNENETNKLLDFMKINFPTSILSEVHKNLIEFTLPFKDTKLSKIFGTIEKNRNELNIKDYSVSQTTLDQIFVDFAKAQEEDGMENVVPHIYNTKNYVIQNSIELNRENNLNADLPLNKTIIFNNQQKLTLNIPNVEETSLNESYTDENDDNDSMVTKL